MNILARLKHYLRCERGFLGIGGDQTTTVNVDPSTQAYQDQYLRPGAVAAANALRGLPQFGPQSYMGFMNPYEQSVINAIQADFDRQRQAGLGQSLDAGTLAGGGGRGSRQGVRDALVLRDINQNEAGTLAALRNSNYGQANQLALAMQQANQAGLLAPLQALQGGIGATGQQQTVEGPGFLGGLVQGIGGLAGIAGGLGFSPFGGGS